MLNKNSGTYSHCSNCKLEKNCCKDFYNIDNIVITNKEKEVIVSKVGTAYDKYFAKINKEAYNILDIDGVCPFYDNCCTIYAIRPSDCRMFPYDIKEIKGKYYLIQYDLPCGSKFVDEDVDDVVEVLKTIIKTYTNKKVNKKVNKFKYKIIKQIDV